MNRLRARYGHRRVNWLATMLLIGIGSVAYHLLAHHGLHSSALLYIGIPYLGALAIVIVRPTKSDQSWWHRYRDLSLTSLIVLLGSSVVLFEGFICVLFFLPIYFLVVSLVFALDWLAGKAPKGKSLSALVPIIVLGSSFEGTTEVLSVDRIAQAEASRVADLTPEELMRNLTRPIDLQKDRNWMLSIFPMPYRVEAESLELGAVHRLRTRYHRWFVTNTHEGELRLEIIDVAPNRIRTRITHDSSFFAPYLTQIGSEVSLTPIAPDRTEVRLRLNYRRNLDPAWYFHPLQQLAMGQMAAFFIDRVLIRGSAA